MLIFAVVALVLALGGFYLARRPSRQEWKGGEAANQRALPTATETAAEETTPPYAGTVLAGTESPLLDFTKADYERTLATDKLIVLYFYAHECPVCQVEFPKIQELFSELATDRVIGFRVNYNDSDTDTDERNLARAFGVAYPNTKIFVKNRARVLKSSAEWDKERYRMEISRTLGVK